MNELDTNDLVDFILSYKKRVKKDNCYKKSISTYKKYKYEGMIVKVVVINPKYQLEEQNRIIRKNEKIVKESGELVKNALLKKESLLDNFPELDEPGSLLED